MNLNFIQNEVVISFSRIINDECVGYEIFTIDNNEEYLLTYIENPKTNLNIYERKEFDYRDDLKFGLPKDVIASNSCDIKVFVNNVEINVNNYSYDDYKKIICIHKDSIIQNDVIEIEYKVDRIKYKHITNKVFKYRIKPIYSKNFIIGQHSVL